MNALFPAIGSREERERLQAARARRASRPTLAAWACGAGKSALPPFPTHDMTPELRRMFRTFLAAASGPLAGREASTAEGGGEETHGPGIPPTVTDDSFTQSLGRVAAKHVTGRASCEAPGHPL